jgi:chromosomal replication initiation ATPase DnaA
MGAGDCDYMRQVISDERIANRSNNNKENNQEQPRAFNTVHVQNIVKVVDKTYLDKNFHKSEASELVDNTVKAYSLNEEQVRAFCIIANHAISDHPEQLYMYLGGMGGTGKTQLIKALTNFFFQREEAHRFIVVAPTGTAAALLRGSTYHSTFGINDRSRTSRVGHIKAKLIRVEYVFLDEVSMLSARDLYQINLQLARVFEKAEIPFGSLNMIFSGDFAQLPPGNWWGTCVTVFKKYQ